jgi:hypothetical protein
MTTTQAQIVEMLEQLPDGALDEVKSFLAALQNRYQNTHTQQPLSRGQAMVAAMKGKGTSGLTTDEIMQLTRGEE